jgi:hypothetical protein
MNVISTKGGKTHTGTHVERVGLPSLVPACGVPNTPGRAGKTTYVETQGPVDCARCLKAADTAPDTETAPAAPKEPKATRTFDATTATEHRCAGACGEVKAVKAFPTVKGPAVRGVECRACRDARVKAGKESKAAAA